MYKRVLCIVLVLFTALNLVPINYKVSASKEIKASEVVAYAKKFLGNKYVYGGTSLTNGTDCSGFTMGVYKKFGVKLPHSSGGQDVGGEVVPRDEARAGDVVIIDKSGQGRGGHVVLMVTSTKIIHASNPTKGICMGKLSDYDKYFVRVVRIKGVVDDTNGKEVDAGSPGSSGGKKIQKLSAEKEKELMSKLGIDDKKLEQLRAMWTACVATGYNEAAICGALGNYKCESGLNPKCVESGASNPGIGLAQWTTAGEKKELVNWSKKCGHKTESLAGNDVCVNFGCQVAFMLKDLQAGKWKTNAAKYNSKYNDYAPDFKGDPTGKHGVSPKDLKFDIELYPTLKSFKGAKDAWSAAIAFHDSYEISAGVNYYIHRNKTRVTPNTSGWQDGDFFVSQHVWRPKYAEMFMELMGGTTSGNGGAVDKDTANTIGNQLVKCGLWDEKQFADYNKLNEKVVEFANINDYTEDDVYNVKTWQEDISEGNIEDWLIRDGRLAIMLFGILILIWMILMYIAFWFDKINNIIDIELLPIVSFGKLMVSPDEYKCTFNVKDLAKGKRKTINFRYMNYVVLTGICIGCLIVSGAVFSGIMYIVNTVEGLWSRLL